MHLDATGGWHVCNRGTCDIIQLRETVCIKGEHIIPGPRCPQHPQSAVISVHDVYACRKIGCVHVCDRTTCQTEDGKCCISGLSCVAAEHVSLALPAYNKRSRRRLAGVHTNAQSACILLYNLLFSARRVNSEIQRASNVLELARRKSQRVVKTAVRAGTQLRYQAIVDIFNGIRQRMRYTAYMTTCRPDTREAICQYYADVVVDVWDTVARYMPSRSTFESTCAAILYAQRKGVACDGLHAIPADRFMLCALPDAHAIKDVEISRRLLTQARNALLLAIQSLIHSGKYTVEEFALKFKMRERPAILVEHFS